MSDERLNGMLRRVVRTVNPDTGATVEEETWYPGRILQLWREVVAQTDALPPREKPDGRGGKLKFKVRDAMELIDKLRSLTNSLGIIIYPGVGTNGKGLVTDDGTLVDVNMMLVAQAVEDGSLLVFAGYGQGADNQDKAGGKAMTYAHKAILIQAAMLGGTKTAKALGVRDTDDDDAPIKGGVKPKTAKPTLAALRKQLEEVEDKDDYEELRPTLLALTPEDQTTLTPDIIAAKQRAGLPVPQQKTPSKDK